MRSFELVSGAAQSSREGVASAMPSALKSVRSIVLTALLTCLAGCGNKGCSSNVTAAPNGAEPVLIADGE
jgi:hypothetical protein